MLLQLGLLAFLASIDSIGIGINYGVRNIKITKMATGILFTISLIISTLAILMGNGFEAIFPKVVTQYLGSGILIVMGMMLLFQSLKKPESYDTDNSKYIDSKEAISLGIALSLDSFSIGIGTGVLVNENFFIFPILVATFQILFLLIGRILGAKLKKASKIPSFLWNIIAATLLIIIGVVSAF